MSENPHRTIVCSVLFLDIEGYSKRSVTEQLTLKQQFNAFLVVALLHVATDDRIVLDTGDGAAVCFLSDPEDSLFAAMSLRDATSATDTSQTPPMHLRIGINLGPVRLLKDINNQINIIGDGINDAQRVMSFAEPGKILVSRSYYEVVSRLSNDYVRLFAFEGTRTDKHVREHDVYAVGLPTPGSVRAFAARSVTDQDSQRNLPAPASIADQPATVASAQDAPTQGMRKRITIAVVALLVLLGIGMLWFWPGKAPEGPPPSQESVKPKASPASRPEPPKPSEIKQKADSSPVWLIQMRKDLVVCDQQGFINRVICTEKVRWKYCDPSNWNKFEECRVKKPING